MIIGIYALFYIFMFYLLENRDVRVYHIVHTSFDEMIPFCEVFIIPYMLWFPYMIGVVLYFIFRKKGDKSEYYQLCFNLIMGMSIFLIVSYLYPNIQHLRPTEFARDNIFTRAVASLYAKDTPTNILPSIHVFNSMAIHMSVANSKVLQNRRDIRIASLILTTLIILSTMFLKQHSVIDVCLGATMAMFGHLIFYPQQSFFKAFAPTLPSRSSR